MQEEPAVPASLQQVRGRATLNTAAQNPKCRYICVGQHDLGPFYFTNQAFGVRRLCYNPRLAFRRQLKPFEDGILTMAQTWMA